MPIPNPPTSPPQVLTTGGPARQPSSGPLDALRKASSIGPLQLPTMQGGVPLPVEGAIQGLTQAAPKIAETLGETLPEFTPVGGEDIYNVARAAAQKVANPLESVYNAILRKGGR